MLRVAKTKLLVPFDHNIVDVDVALFVFAHIIKIQKNAFKT